VGCHRALGRAYCNRQRRLGSVGRRRYRLDLLHGHSGHHNDLPPPTEARTRAVGLTFAALAVMPLAAFLAPKAGIVPEHMWRPNVPLTESFTILSVFVVVFFVGIAIGILAWPVARPHSSRLRPGRAHPDRVADARGHAGQLRRPLRRPAVLPDERARVVGRDRAGAATLVLDLDHDRVRCAVWNRRRGDRAAAGNGSRLDSRTRRARGDVATRRA